MKKVLVIIGAILLLAATYLITDNFLFDGFRPRSINQQAFQADYFAKTDAKNQPAIVILGGGQTGHYWSEQFVNRGMVGLSLPYIGKAGLPKLPEEIPLEYFKNALKWLSKQPEVNPEKILVMGASRNAELALVLASTFPDLVSGVIAYAPSAVSWSNTVLPYSSDEIKASWTYKGANIPYISMDKISGGESNEINTLAYWKAGLEKVEEVEQATIKVEKINGPILLLSGKSDGVWPSAEMANMIEKRIDQSSFKFAFQNMQFENAGHLISRNPDSDSDTSERTGRITINGKDYQFDFGGTMEGDNKAKKLAKKKVIEFINGL